MTIQTHAHARGSLVKCRPPCVWVWIGLLYCLSWPLQCLAENDSHEISQETRSTPGNAFLPPFGRLFTTPQERELLNSLRQRQGTMTQTEDITVDQAPPTKDSPSIASTQSPSLKLSGIVIRADGKQQVWINGELQPQLKIPAQLQPNSSETTRSATLTVPLKQQNQSTILKPGQVWNPESDEITESYRRSTSQPPQVVEP